MENLKIPNPVQDEQVISYDLRLVDLAESRVEDIATTNTTKGQELLSIFCKASFALSKVYSDLQLQISLAKDRLNRRKAIMIIDVIPPIIKEKKLQDNQMSRQAFLDLDEEYSKASQICDQIQASIVFVEKQLKAIEGALSGIKKIYDATRNTYNRPNPNLVTELDSVPSLTENTIDGKIKYGTPSYSFERKTSA